MSLAQLAPSNAAESSNLTVCADADDQRAMATTTDIARIGFMASYRMKWVRRVKLLGEEKVRILRRFVGWAKPTGRANARPMTGSACPPNFCGGNNGGHGAKSAFAHPTLHANLLSPPRGRVYNRREKRTPMIH